MNTSRLSFVVVMLLWSVGLDPARAQSWSRLYEWGGCGPCAVIEEPGGDTTVAGASARSGFLLQLDGAGNLKSCRSQSLGSDLVQYSDLAQGLSGDHFVVGSVDAADGMHPLLNRIDATTGDVVWAQTADVTGGFFSVAVCADGALLAVGEVIVNRDLQLLAVRYDEDGTILWSFHFGGASGTESADRVVATEDGGCFIAGNEAAGVQPADDVLRVAVGVVMDLAQHRELRGRQPVPVGPFDLVATSPM